MRHYDQEKFFHYDYFGKCHILEDKLEGTETEKSSFIEKKVYARKVDWYRVIAVGALLLLDAVATFFYDVKQDDDALPLR
jgi:hypothetical protein